MGMQNPAVSEPLDRLSDVFPEGTPFIIDGIRTVEATTADYGKGEMVVIRARGRERELGVWGSYLLAQAKSVEPSDLGRAYVVVRKVVPGFGKDRAVKAFEPATMPPGTQESLPPDTPAGP